MGIDPVQLRDLVIRPALQDLGMYSDAAVNLLLGTAATESQMGLWLKQINGPAVGIYQMEPSTYRDIWARWPRDAKLDRGYLDAWRMIHDLRYATMYARMKYYFDPDPLPGDKIGLAGYYKRVYNTMLGKSSASKFLDDVERYARNAWLGAWD